MTKDEYQYYLATPHWAEVVAETTKLAGGKCVRCPADGRDCHHTHYGSLGREIPGVDVILLCRRCHEAAHGISGSELAAKSGSCRDCRTREATVCDHPSGHWVCMGCLELRRLFG